MVAGGSERPTGTRGLLGQAPRCGCTSRPGPRGVEDGLRISGLRRAEHGAGLHQGMNALTEEQARPSACPLPHLATDHMVSVGSPRDKKSPEDQRLRSRSQQFSHGAFRAPQSISIGSRNLGAPARPERDDDKCQNDATVLTTRSRSRGRKESPLRRVVPGARHARLR